MRSSRQSRPNKAVQQQAQTPVARGKSFPIVGIGASAGGLEAITAFLKSLPENTGLAFVFVQHLDPSHPSTLTEILARSSHIPVEEVEEGVVVRPNHGYVIPPNSEMSLQNGALHLVPRQPRGSVTMPVDRLFVSLATECRHQAIGVILSGTGSDGREGCRAIKEAGGIIFAQSEASAKYSGMPHSALESGCVDFTLPPNEIAQKLSQLGAHPYLWSEMSLEAPVYDQNDVHSILNVVSDRTGIDLTQYKPTTLQRRIQRRMALLKIDQIKDYIERVQSSPEEVEALHRDLLISVTSFFREPSAFEALRKYVFQPLFLEGERKADIRIWVPGCATGEEAYSIGITLAEHLSEVSQKMAELSVQIFATDVNEDSLEKARLALYPASIEKDLTPERLHRFFVKQDGNYRVHKSLREWCVFAKQNVAKDPPFSNLDLISCRNLLIYFGEPLKTRVIPAFHYALRPGGYLMLGASETLGQFADQFATIEKKEKIYQKKKDAPRLLTYFVGSAVAPISRETPRSRDQSAAQSLERQFDRALLEAFGATSIVVTEQLDIVHLRGNTSDYIVPPSGQPSFNLNRVAREGLLLDLRAAIRAAKKSGRTVYRKGLNVESDRGLLRVDLSVHMYTPPGMRDQYFVIAFHGSSPRRKSGQTSPRGRSSSSRQPGRKGTRQELANAKDQIKGLIEDHEATLEEYRSANEEVLSSNEELQSLNEEMETAKEELQSTNEELRTLNEELQTRNSELATANDDLSNLFSNASVPILMVSNDLSIRRFTPQAQSLLNLTPADIGRKVSEIHSSLRGVELTEFASEVISSVSPRETEVQGNDGVWYLMRVRAYKTSTHHIGGAVFVFQNIDLLKRSLEESRSYTVTLIESAREPILVLDSNLRVITANNSFYRTFLVEPSQTEGGFVYELGDGQWDIQELRNLLENILPEQARIDNFEVTANFPQIGTKVMRLNARRIESQMRKEAILLAIEDITEQRQSERALRELSNRMMNIEDTERRRIARDVHDVTGQKISALSLNLRLISKQISNGESHRTLSETIDLADQITNDIRGLSYLLHPPMLDELGLVPALREYVNGVSERTGLLIEFDAQDHRVKLPSDIEITIFRIVQEALANTHRHSGSSKAKVVLNGNEREIELQIVDFGRGFSTVREGGSEKKLAAKNGVGLTSMKERVKHIGGSLQIQSGERGTSVIARVPLSGAR